MRAPEVVYTYILKGENGRHYTGITNDLDRRLKEHQAGQCKSTKKYGSLKLIWTERFDTRKEARAREVLIKKKGAAQYLKTYGGHKVIWIGERTGECRKKK